MVLCAKSARKQFISALVSRRRRTVQTPALRLGDGRHCVIRAMLVRPVPVYCADRLSPEVPPGSVPFAVYASYQHQTPGFLGKEYGRRRLAAIASRMTRSRHPPPSRPLARIAKSRRGHVAKTQHRVYIICISVPRSAQRPPCSYRRLCPYVHPNATIGHDADTNTTLTTTTGPYVIQRNGHRLQDLQVAQCREPCAPGSLARSAHAALALAAAPPACASLVL